MWHFYELQYTSTSLGYKYFEGLFPGAQVTVQFVTLMGVTCSIWAYESIWGDMNIQAQLCTERGAIYGRILPRCQTAGCNE